MDKKQRDIRTMSSNAAKQQWGALMSAVVKDGDEVVVESHGKPTVAVISYDDFLAYRADRDRKRREEALAQLRAFEKRQATRNSDLTEKEIEALSLRASREAIDDLVAEGKLAFERDQD